MAQQYTAPTLQDLKKAFGDSQIGRPIKGKGKKCLDAQRFISKLNKAYRATKKSSIQFD